MKKIILIIFAAFSLTFLCCSCGESEGNTSENRSDSIGKNEYLEITELDLDASEEGAQEVSFDKGGICLINQGGTYLLKGDYQGQIRIDTKEYPVHLILDNVRVQSTHGPALYVVSASKVVLTAKEETENEFQDSAEYEGEKDANGCIYSEADLSINGTGTILVYGNKKSAICSKDCLKIFDSKIRISSKKDGVRANDGIVMCPGEMTIESEGSGIVTRKSGKDGKGCLDVCGGEISVVAGKYAILSAQDLLIRNCSLTLKSIILDYSCEGNMSIQKGCITNE